MAYNFPIAPGAYNWWEGNNFRIPPLGQYARPVYADALRPVANADPTMAQALPQAADPRLNMGSGLGIGEMQNLSDRMSTPGMGLDAKSASLGDFARSAITGPIEAFVSFGGQALANGLAGRPNAPINNVDFLGLADAVRDAFGSEQQPAPTAPAPPAPGDWGSGDIADPGGIGSGYSGAPSEADRQAADTLGSTGMYSKGGSVRGLLGPNPPGPDDGFGGLDRGEFVVNKREARKHRGLLDAINKGKVSKKKARSLLD